MADSSSFMDWLPASPLPVHNPYQGNYMPGGWPVEGPPQPAPTAGVFAKRPSPGILPTAKRVCRGLFSLTLTATAVLSQYTLSATSTVVAVPTYYVVRQVQQRQRERRHQRPRRQRTPPTALTTSPWHRAVMGVNNGSLWEVQPSQEAPPSPAPVRVAAPTQVTASAPSHAPLPTSRKVVDQNEIVPFHNMVWEAGSTGTKREGKKPSTLITKRRYPTAPTIRAIRRRPTSSIHPSSQDIGEAVQEASAAEDESAQLQTPYPNLEESSLSSLATSDSPTAQSQQDVDTPERSDSVTPILTVARSVRSNKRKIEEQGSRESVDIEGSTTAKRVQTTGPSLEFPDTPTPVKVAQETSSAVKTKAQTTIDTSLLSPPRVKNRKVSTPTSVRNKSKAPKTPESQIIPSLEQSEDTPKSAESDISSTCNASPQLTLLEKFKQLIHAKSPESDISSTCDAAPDLTELEALNQISSPGSDISSTCDIAPELTLLEKLNQARSPKSPQSPQSDISSTCDVAPELTLMEEQFNLAKSPLKDDTEPNHNGITHDPSEDASLTNIIMAGGGSPTVGEEVTTHSKQTAVTTESAQATVSETTSNHIGTKVPEAADQSAPTTLDLDAPQVTAETTSHESSQREAQNIISPDEPQAIAETTAQDITDVTGETSLASVESQGMMDFTKQDITQGPTETSLASEQQQHGITESSQQAIAGEPAGIPLTSDAQNGTTDLTQAMDIAPGAGQQSSATVLNDVEMSEPSAPKTPPKKVAFADPTTPTNKTKAKSSEVDDGKTTEQRFAELTLDEPFTPEHPTPKASPHSSEKKQRITRAEAKRLQLIEEAQHYRITPLTEDWEQKVEAALRQGHGDFKATDFTRVVPLSSGRGTDNWLNDEVINGYLKLVVAHGRQNDRPTQVPTHHAFVSFFYNNLESKGYEGVRRWATRAKIGGKNLLETEQVFIPINSGMHWTLCVVSGKNKTITHYNSLGGNGARYVEKVKEWVRAELGASFKEEEWRVNAVGETPKQQNMDDCGVFTITSARQIMLGLSPLSYQPEQISLQRRRIVAELVHGALLKSQE